MRAMLDLSLRDFSWTHTLPRLSEIHSHDQTELWITSGTLAEDMTLNSAKLAVLPTFGINNVYIWHMNAVLE